ncbi:fatty acid desaturase 4, chloroplastic-like [Cynara cardunculus var. scolymus]|uniref:Kua-ubiquitin conjugating enzyme hybrid, localization n=1 Tax=Cynara cardunculus var. scolymus TaxID=59895 RepID=A0A103XY77_CYNCS|nr:fatty acid desaturase 4, chloroplastic-like [Cynara cardunculus var. scolymus]KVH99123.1 Kua-ubiquitin conjugating enzyme hybrid, localization [Cynara cardunculus var. scolymus]
MLKLNQTPLITPPTFHDPSLNPTWSHHVWVATGCTTVLFSLANAVVYGSTHSHTWLKTILAGFIGYLFVDLFSGVYHWVFDNYGDFSIPILGSHIDTFRRHHELPWATTKRQFSSNLHVAARIITHVVPPMNLIWHDQPAVMGFVGMFSGGVLFAVQIHAWAHESKSKLPAMVVALQDAGVVIAQSRHAAHHRSGDSSYCIVSGVWNRVLDEYKVFAGLEKVVFFVLGVQPRSWSEANSGGTAAMATPEAYFEPSPP